MQPPNTGQVILAKIGVWTRAALDIRTDHCRADPTGLHIIDCFISVKPRKRGSIHITPSGQGLYEIAFKDVHGNTVETHDAATLEYLGRLLKRKGGLK